MTGDCLTLIVGECIEKPESFVEQGILNVSFDIGKMNFVTGKERLEMHISGKMEWGGGACCWRLFSERGNNDVDYWVKLAKQERT